MGKINVKGGSDLQIRFRNDKGEDYEYCHLDLVRGGSAKEKWYRVRVEQEAPQASGPALQAVKYDEPQNTTVFRAGGNKATEIEIDYGETKPRPKQRPLTS